MKKEFDGIIIENKQHIREGIYCQNLSITGEAKFVSEVEADVVEITGDACFDSYITCDKLNVRGRCMCKDSLITTSLRVFGALAIYGKLNSETVIVGGGLKFRDSFRTAGLLVKRDAVVKGSGRLKASKCSIEGYMLNTGTVISDSFSIRSNLTSRIQEIRTDLFLVRCDKIKNEDEQNTILVCDYVDCFEADIENCKIDTFYCDTAVIRKGCVINEVFYRDSIEIEQGARVERLSKT